MVLCGANSTLVPPPITTAAAEEADPSRKKCVTCGTRCRPACSYCFAQTCDNCSLKLTVCKNSQQMEAPSVEPEAPYVQAGVNLAQEVAADAPDPAEDPDVERVPNLTKMSSNKRLLKKPSSTIWKLMKLKYSKRHELVFIISFPFLDQSFISILYLFQCRSHFH
jgi:hypothetical protein